MLTVERVKEVSFPPGLSFIIYVPNEYGKKKKGSKSYWELVCRVQIH